MTCLSYELREVFMLDTLANIFGKRAESEIIRLEVKKTPLTIHIEGTIFIDEPDDNKLDLKFCTNVKLAEHSTGDFCQFPYINFNKLKHMKAPYSSEPVLVVFGIKIVYQGYKARNLMLTCYSEGYISNFDLTPESIKDLLINKICLNSQITEDAEELDKALYHITLLLGGEYSYTSVAEVKCHICAAHRYRHFIFKEARILVEGFRHTLCLDYITPAGGYVSESLGIDLR